MKSLHLALPVQFKFFGKPKAFDAQQFDAKLSEFRDGVYASIPDEHNYLRARSLVDSGINAISTLLKNIWNTPEKLDKIKWREISAYMWVDDDYTAYSVKVMYRSDLLATPQCETDASSNFVEAIKAERDEVLQKYGFTPLPPKQYRVMFDHHVAILTEQQVRELREKHPQWFFDVIEEVKSDDK